MSQTTSVKDIPEQIRRIKNHFYQCSSSCDKVEFMSTLVNGQERTGYRIQTNKFNRCVKDRLEDAESLIFDASYIAHDDKKLWVNVIHTHRYFVGVDFDG